MAIVNDVAAIIAACAENPGKRSVWDGELNKFVCEDNPRFKLAVSNQPVNSIQPISPEFKLVFITAFAGSIIFVIVCVTTTLLAGKDMPPLGVEIIKGLMDMAKVGFGAIVGLLGTKILERNQSLK